MKKLFTIIIALAVYSNVLAQSPEKISYQAVIRNTSNQLVANKTVKIKISILQGSSTGSSVYVETHKPTTNANGLASIEIGTGTVESGNLSTVNWASGPFFIKTDADPNGGTNYTISGTSQILSVPYALYAKAAENITGTLNETDPDFNAWDKSTGISITESQISNLKSYLTTESDPTVTSNFDFSNAQTGDLLQYNGSKWVKVTPNYLSSYTESQTLSDVIAKGNNANGQIKNLSEPTENKDAVTKEYVDKITQILENNGLIVVDFVTNLNLVVTGTSINFKDTSAIDASSWLWDFGDGSSSTLQNPVHSYSSPGIFKFSPSLDSIISKIS